MIQKLLPGVTPAPLYCSRERKFTFVHNQKTGGSTIVTMLLDQVDDLEQIALESDWRDVAKTLKQHDCFEGYFLFGFVRNPWDRFVSYYSMVIRKMNEAGAGKGSRWRCACNYSFVAHRRVPKEPLHPDGTTGVLMPCPKCHKRAAVLEEFAPDMRDQLPSKPMWDLLLSLEDKSFSAFTSMLSKLPSASDVGWTGPYAYMRSQVETLSDNGKLFLDEVGRFEHYEADLKRIFNGLGLDASAIPKVNSSPHVHYTEFYTPQTRGFIEQINKPDCEKWGYNYNSELDGVDVFARG